MEDRTRIPKTFYSTTESTLIYILTVSFNRYCKIDYDYFASVKGFYVTRMLPVLRSILFLNHYLVPLPIHKILLLQPSAIVILNSIVRVIESVIFSSK